VRVVPNGRDSARFRARLPKEHRGPVRLVFIGHLSDSKRPQRFVELVRALRTDGGEVEGVIVGDGPLRDVVAAEASDLPIAVLGVVDDVGDVLMDANIFVFTSVTTGEGMPGVLIEAGLAALPVVTTDVPGARAVVEDGTTGLIVPPEDFDALVSATSHLYNDAALRAAMGAAARQRCEERFGLEQSASQWRALLEGLIDPSCVSST
jgi:glycosyltransferase involved in cell wall biosynthesis